MIRAIVTDIEGTTSSLSFVKDILFPYARTNLPGFVRSHAAEPQVKEQLDAVRQEFGAEMDVEAVIQQLLQWIEEDKKVTPLKMLQGLVWQKGYADVDFYGHIYADAYASLNDWHLKGIKLYVYSSGSVYAQKLLYGHTEYGDITSLFSQYFDTHIGAKTEVKSYQNIVDELSLSEPDLLAHNILFLSDIEAELDAAKKAGMQTYWLMREGKITRSAAHCQVNSFAEIVLDPDTKVSN